jgi:small subunit ribosomal protein S16
MAVKMRLRREGKKKQPFYRVVVADVRSPRDGRFIEDLGFYHPLSDPSGINIDRERALYWLRTGVQPSQAVENLLRIEGIWEEFKPGQPDPHADRREKRAAKRTKQTAKLEDAQRRAEEESRKAAEAKAAADAEASQDAAEQVAEENTQPDAPAEADPAEEAAPAEETAAADGSDDAAAKSDENTEPS